MDVFDMMACLRGMPPHAEVWLRIEADDHTHLDIASDVRVDDDGDVVIGGEQ